MERFATAMTKSATDVMQDILFAAVIDGVMALKASSKGLPNTLLRDLNAIHANTTLADLPPELQSAIQTSVRTAFTKLLRDGYSVSPAGSAPPQRTGPPIRRDGPRPQGRPGGDHRPGGGDRPGGNRRPPRSGPGGTGRGPKPGGGGRGPKGGAGR